MNETRTSARSESEPDPEAGSDEGGRGRELLSTVTSALRRGVTSGAATGLVGGVGVLRGVRSLLGGERERGLGELAFGGVFLAAALAQRRSRKGAVEETDVTDTGPDVEGTTTKYNPNIADSAPNVPSDGAAVEEDTEPGDDFQTEETDRLGEAAVDGQSWEVPVPQRAFNQGFLAHSSETFWGIRDRDGAVLLSQDFDAVQGQDGVEYVASSEIGDDVRELAIPTAVIEHWNEAGDGTPVSGGDDVLFVTTDSLQADHLLRVLPSERADDLTE